MAQVGVAIGGTIATGLLSDFILRGFQLSAKKAQKRLSGADENDDNLNLLKNLAEQEPPEPETESEEKEGNPGECENPKPRGRKGRRLHAMLERSRKRALKNMDFELAERIDGKLKEAKKVIAIEDKMLQAGNASMYKLAKDLKEEFQEKCLVLYREFSDPSAVVVQIVRKSGCPLCHEQGLDLSSLQDEFGVETVKLVAIVKPSDINSKFFWNHWKGEEVFIDDEMRWYKMLHGSVGGIQYCKFLLGAMLFLLRPSAWCNFCRNCYRARCKGYGEKDHTDNMKFFQGWLVNGGVLVFDKAGKITYAFRERTPGDLAPLSKVRQGVIDAIASSELLEPGGVVDELLSKRTTPLRRTDSLGETQKEDEASERIVEVQGEPPGEVTETPDENEEESLCSRAATPLTTTVTNMLTTPVTSLGEWAASWYYGLEEPDATANDAEAQRSAASDSTLRSLSWND